MRLLVVAWVELTRFVGLGLFALGLSVMVVNSVAQSRPFADRVDDFYDVLMELGMDERAELCSAYPDLDDSREARQWVSMQQATCESVLVSEDPHPDMYFYSARLQYRSGLLRHKVHEYLRQGAEQGSVKALTALGWMEFKRNEDEQAMVDAYERAAAMGDPVAMTELARYIAAVDYLRYSPGREWDYEPAFQLLEEASAMGYPLADLILGQLHGFHANMEKAETYLRSAADNGVEAAYSALERRGFDVERPADDTESRYPSHYPWDLVMYRRPEHAPEGAFVRSNAKRD